MEANDPRLAPYIIAVVVLVMALAFIAALLIPEEDDE